MKKIVSISFAMVFLAGCSFTDSLPNNTPTITPPSVEQSATLEEQGLEKVQEANEEAQVEKEKTAMADTVVSTSELSVMQRLLSDYDFRTQEYDMSRLSVDMECFNPCDPGCETEKSAPLIDSRLSPKVSTLYTFLLEQKYDLAANMLLEQPELTAVFAYCSAFHNFHVFLPHEKGVIVFTSGGNGLPTIPNETYSLGLIQAKEGKLVLYETFLQTFYDGTNYGELVMNNDWEKAEQVGNQRVEEIVEGMKTGIFVNKNIEAEYTWFVNLLNNF